MIMEYQNIINFSDNTPNHPNRFRTKNWVEINNDSRRTYNTNSQTKSKTSYNFLKLIIAMHIYL